MKTERYEIHRSITLKKDDFRRPPEYHLDSWADICSILDAPVEAEQITIWTDTVDVDMDA